MNHYIKKYFCGPLDKQTNAQDVIALKFTIYSKTHFHTRSLISPGAYSILALNSIYNHFNTIRTEIISKIETYCSLGLLVKMKKDSTPHD